MEKTQHVFERELVDGGGVCVERGVVKYDGVENIGASVWFYLPPFLESRDLMREMKDNTPSPAISRKHDGEKNKNSCFNSPLIAFVCFQ